jgi:hypothetical protein
MSYTAHVVAIMVHKFGKNKLSKLCYKPILLAQ